VPARSRPREAVEARNSWSMRLRKRCWSWLSMRTRVRRQWRDSPSRRTAGGGRRNDLAVGQNEGWGNTRVNLSRTFAIQRLRETQGWTVFHLPSTRTVFETPSAPWLRAHRPQAGVLDDKQRRPASEVSREVLLLRTEDAPQILHLASAWRSRRGPPRRGHAPRAVCLVRRGCSPPSLFNRAGFDAKVAYRVVVAPAPVQRGGRAPRRARAVADGRHRPLQRLGQHLPRLSSLDRPRSAFLCGATVPARARRVSDPRRRPPLGSGGSSRYCQSGRARGTLGHARSSAWHASVLSCLLPRMTPGAAPPANRRSYARRSSGTLDLRYCLAGCLPEPSKLCAHVGEPARPFPACVMLLHVLSTNRDRRATP